jgi:hypothetical protein
VPAPVPPGSKRPTRCDRHVVAGQRQHEGRSARHFLKSATAANTLPKVQNKNHRRTSLHLCSMLGWLYLCHPSLPHAILSSSDAHPLHSNTSLRGVVFVCKVLKYETFCVNIRLASRALRPSPFVIPDVLAAPPSICG